MPELLASCRGEKNIPDQGAPGERHGGEKQHGGCGVPRVQGQEAEWQEAVSTGENPVRGGLPEEPLPLLATALPMSESSL